MNLLSKNKRMILYSAFAIVFLLLWFFYQSYHHYVSITSDSTTMLPVAADLINGNVFLKGWVLGTNNFIFTETIFYSFGLLLGFGYSTLIHAVPALFYALFILSMLFIFIYKDNDYKSVQFKDKIILFILYIILAGLVPFQSAYTLLNPNSHNNLYFWTILAWFLIIRYFDTAKKRYLVSFIIIAVLSAFSEDVTIMALFAPLGLYCLYGIWKDAQKRKNYIIVLCAVAVCFLAAKSAAYMIKHTGGLVTRGLPIGSAIKDSLGRFVEFIPQLSVLFGFDGLQSVGFTDLSHIYNLFMLITMVLWLASIVYNTVRFKDLSRMDKFLYLASVVNIAGCLFTNVGVHYRYIVLAYLFGTMLLIKTVLRLCAGKQIHSIRNIIAKIVIAAVVCLTVFGYRFSVIPKLYAAGTAQTGVAKIINDKGYGNGYGDFWCASLISYDTGFQTSIYPIIMRKDKNYPYAGKIYPYVELIKKDWYKEKDKHFIITFKDQGSEYIKNDIMFSLLGQPDDSFIYENYEAFYWKKDISDFLTDSYTKK